MGVWNIPGATLYTDRRMFLDEHPTLNERLSRSSLIAHETSHMWFGDYVTMKWFDDVWTKEVFANYFASRIVEPLYPGRESPVEFYSGLYSRILFGRPYVRCESDQARFG